MEGWLREGGDIWKATGRQLSGGWFPYCFLFVPWVAPLGYLSPRLSRVECYSLAISVHGLLHPPWPPLASTRPRAAARTRLRVNPHPFLFFAEPAPHIMRIGEWLFLSFLGAGPDWRLIDHLLISRCFHGSPCHLTAIAQDSIQAPIRPFKAD